MSYKDKLKQLDHDCKNGPESGCSACYEINEMSEEEAKKAYKRLK